ncbi:hypothetical protein KY321_02730 [Candidatus Woesearchaeota archaeon]|nr:hypothetical protein [Candidatus Woesearchaeota archaeon]
MADKGFFLKVLLPTDDGISISNKGIKNARYYLMYNLSNRSYQLAGKVKCKEYFNNSEFDFHKFEELCKQNRVDQIIDGQKELDIGMVLNELIDIIDKKNELQS